MQYSGVFLVRGFSDFTVFYYDGVWENTCGDYDRFEEDCGGEIEMRGGCAAVLWKSEVLFFSSLGVLVILKTDISPARDVIEYLNKTFDWIALSVMQRVSEELHIQEKHVTID